MVGGYVIEIKELLIEMADDGVAAQQLAYRLWVMDPRTYDENIVYVKPATVMPKLGDQVWWQSRRVFFAKDTRSLAKIGNSASATSLTRSEWRAYT